jgi:hypothetical protein
MPDHELELRLAGAARALDVRAPAFDASLLRDGPPRRIRRGVIGLICVVGLAGVAAGPATVSALRGLFDVDRVPALGPREPGVAPAYAGRVVPVSAVQASSSFRVRLIRSLGKPDEARVRDDIQGGMITLVYRSRGLLLTQWRTTDVHARIAVVPDAGSAETVDVRGTPALWVEGAARGTFTLVGADGATHRESFGVSPGVLLWREGGMSFLLQGARTERAATRLAAAR